MLILFDLSSSCYTKLDELTLLIVVSRPRPRPLVINRVLVIRNPAFKSLKQISHSLTNDSWLDSEFLPAYSQPRNRHRSTNIVASSSIVSI